jgi:hypothetical protein
MHEELPPGGSSFVSYITRRYKFARDIRRRHSMYSADALTGRQKTPRLASVQSRTSGISSVSIFSARALQRGNFGLQFRRQR